MQQCVNFVQDHHHQLRHQIKRRTAGGITARPPRSIPTSHALHNSLHHLKQNKKRRRNKINEKKRIEENESKPDRTAWWALVQSQVDGRGLPLLHAKHHNSVLKKCNHLRYHKVITSTWYRGATQVPRGLLWLYSGFDVCDVVCNYLGLFYPARNCRRGVIKNDGGGMGVI